MYRILTENIKGYFNSFDKSDERYKIALPIKLLLSKDDFDIERKRKTENYKNLCLIIDTANQLKHLSKFVKFNLAFRELDNLGFIFEEIDDFKISKDDLISQIDILRQNMYFTYLS